MNFNQGLDVRLLDEEGAKLINQIKTKMVHFAWDNYEMHTKECLERARDWLDKDDRSVRVYVLTNYNTNINQDLERIYTIKSIGFDPFVMVYDKPHAPQQIRQLQRWCNNKRIFRRVDSFYDYKAN